jgi:prophage antirepressor-like protein
MENLQVFKNSEFGEIGVLLIDGREYFPATACAKILGYKDATNAIKQHCRWVVKHHLPHPQSPSKTIDMKFIPEGDLFRLITSSKLPAAERFERWVFDEVLPTIRKQGAYIPAAQLPEIIAQTVQATVIEMTKQLIPAIVDAVSTALRDNRDAEPPEEEVTTTIIVERKRKRNRVSGKIDKLPQPIKNQVIEMMKDENNSYEFISAFLKKNGHDISRGAVGRFCKRKIY